MIGPIVGLIHISRGRAAEADRAIC